MTSKANYLILTGALATMCFFLCLPAASWANNIQVSNVILKQCIKGTTTNSCGESGTHNYSYMGVTFDIKWDNSWYDQGYYKTNDNTNPGNFDAAWVFLKYSTDNGTTWFPAYLKVDPSDTSCTSSCPPIVNSQNHYGIPTGIKNPYGFSKGVCPNMNTYSGPSCPWVDIIAPIDYYCDGNNTTPISGSPFNTYIDTCLINNIGNDPGGPSISTQNQNPFCTAHPATKCGVYNYGTSYTLNSWVSPLTVGVFIQPNQIGAYSSGQNTGTFWAKSVKVIWDYTVYNPADPASIIPPGPGSTGGLPDSPGNNTAGKALVQVMAVEMVYIPNLFFVSKDNAQNTYLSLGDGAHSGISNNSTDDYNNLFAQTVSGTDSHPAFLQGTPDGTEPSFTFGQNASVNSNYAPSSTAIITIPDSLPKGTKAFYLMKYGVSQGQFVDFLNTLTRTQQNDLTPHLYLASNPPNSYPFSQSSSPSSRNYIQLSSITNSATKVNFSLASIPGGGTASFIPVNYVDWTHENAYSAWAGLRPMTELEYFRSTQKPIANVRINDQPPLFRRNMAWDTTNVNLTGSAPNNAAPGAWLTPIPNALIQPLTSTEGIEWDRDVSNSSNPLTFGPVNETWNGNYVTSIPDGPMRTGWSATCYDPGDWTQKPCTTGCYNSSTGNPQTCSSQCLSNAATPTYVTCPSGCYTSSVSTASVACPSKCKDGTGHTIMCPITEEQAGASYWGAQDLLGNLVTPAVVIAGPSAYSSFNNSEKISSLFDGTNGNGQLSADPQCGGYARNADWPGYDPTKSVTNNNMNYPTTFGQCLGSAVFQNQWGSTRGCSWLNTQYCRPQQRNGSILSAINPASGYNTGWYCQQDVGLRSVRTAP